MKLLRIYESYLSCPEKDDDDSDSTDNTAKRQLSQKKLPYSAQIKSCLKKTSLNDYSDLRTSTTTQFSDVKRGSDNKSNRISLRFAEDGGDLAFEIKGFALDCIDIKKRTLSSDMELNPTFGLRSKLMKKQPNTQAIPYKNGKAEFKLDNFILEEEEDEDLYITRIKTELITKQSRARSCSSIFSKLKEKLDRTNFLEEESD